jgi:tubulin polyglutamylase TTLL5
MRLRPHSANLASNLKPASNAATRPPNETTGMYDGMNQIEQTILKTSMDENERSGGWIRLFPTADSWEFYSQYLETRSTGYNMMLHKKLFPKRWLLGSNQPKKATQSRAK